MTIKIQENKVYKNTLGQRVYIVGLFARLSDVGDVFLGDNRKFYTSDGKEEAVNKDLFHLVEEIDELPEISTKTDSTEDKHKNKE